MRIKILVFLFVGFTIVLPVFAQNDGATPTGANTAQDLYSPALAGAGGFTTSSGSAAAGALNPAAEGDAQRIIFNAGYLALPGLGDESGFGLGAAGIGAVFPAKIAVFGGSLWFLRSPFASFPVETTFQGNLFAAKELFPNMSFGLGLNLGYNTGNELTVSGDLGFRWNIGTVGPLENFTLALAARSLGKSWIPPAFTPAAGISFDLFRLRGAEGKADPLRMSLSADLMMPTVQNLAGKVGLSFLIAEFINISSSTQFNIRESTSGNAPSPIPSIGIGLIWKLKSGGQRIIGGALPTDGELAIDVAAKPLYNGIWAMGGGVTWTVGVIDKNPPIIALDYSEPAWISPNNDGKADYLEIPITITDERYITEWVMEIFSETGSAEDDNPVRVYRNKEIRPETQGVQNFISRLGAVKAGVEVPDVLRWDGVLDSGEIAPDGKYFFTITAKDDNSNTAKSGPHEVNVRNTPPAIAITPFPEDTNIFAPGGGGGKDTVTIAQRGSREDLWEAGIYSAEGGMVKTLTFIDSEPSPVVWDGRDDSGNIVPDGVYNYRISATDKAMNSEEASIENIIVNTVRPVVGLSIPDAYFSPNGNGVKDTQTIILTVPVKEGISGWGLEITGNSGTAERTYQGSASAAPPDRVEFDGRNNTGRILPEGVYSAKLEVRYRNGFVSAANSPAFTLDITPPRAAVQIEDKDQGPGIPAVFSPNNTGIKDELILIQEGSAENSWIGEVRRRGDTGGAAVRTFRFSGTPPARYTWNGINDGGALAPDGFYTYQLSCTDPAGNTGRSNIVEFELNTKDTPVFISTDLRAFSPNNDGVKDAINLIPQIQEKDGVLTWKIEILDLGTGTPGGASSVRTFEGRGEVPSSIVWNGRNNAGAMARDGTYAARLDMEYRSGNRPTALSMAFGLKTVPPQGEISVPFNIFAPNGNGNRDTLPIRVTTEGSEEWNLAINDSRNNTVRTWNWTGRAPAVPLPWDGKDQAGNTVNDGVYNITLNSVDEAGNSTRRTINNITVDARVPKVFLTSSSQAIAPKPNQAEALRFNILATPNDGVTAWKLELRDENNATVKSFPSPSGGTGALPGVIPWNGADDRGSIREGRFSTSLIVTYAKGDVVNVTSPPVLVDVSGPILGFFSEPDYFSPDNDGIDDELLIYLSARDASPIAEWSLEISETEGTGQLFYRTGGRGSPSDRIIWDGRSNWGELVQSAMDYGYKYSAVDALGNASTITGKISTDVLVIRDGDILRIQIPSITFRANYADFIGIPQERLENNTRVLKRISEILNRFRDYRITVEGHANPVLGTAREENEVLMPLSLARAQFVIDYLAGIGVNRNRLSPIGRGGTNTVANAQDQANNWKNRRVEFLLIK